MKDGWDGWNLLVNIHIWKCWRDRWILLVKIHQISVARHHPLLPSQRKQSPILCLAIRRLFPIDKPSKSVENPWSQSERWAGWVQVGHEPGKITKEAPFFCSCRLDYVWTAQQLSSFGCSVVRFKRNKSYSPLPSTDC